MRPVLSIMVAGVGWLSVIASVAGLVLMVHPALFFMVVGGWARPDVTGGVLGLFAMSVGLMLFGLLSIHTAGRLRQSRFPIGCCPHCGYDLRGAPQSNRCAECGAAV